VLSFEGGDPWRLSTWDTWSRLRGVDVLAPRRAASFWFSTPAFFSAIFATAKPSERGAAAGIASLFIDLGLGFGPIALGFVAQDATIPAALAAGAACAAAGAFGVLHLYRRAGAATAS
jgi:hypothetical protein